MTAHNHVTQAIREPGECLACDEILAGHPEYAPGAMRTTRPDPRQEGYDTGREMAVKVTDLTYHTEWLQVCEPRIPVTVPLDAAGRREWLHGYAAGIHSVLEEQA